MNALFLSAATAPQPDFTYTTLFEVLGLRKTTSNDSMKRLGNGIEQSGIVGRQQAVRDYSQQRALEATLLKAVFNTAKVSGSNKGLQGSFLYS